MNQNQIEKYREEFEVVFSEKFNKELCGYTLRQWTNQETIDNEHKIGLFYYLQAKQQSETEIEKLREQIEIAEAVLSVQVTDSAMKYFEDKAKQLLESEGV